RKKGKVTERPARAAKTPLRDTSSRKVGPCPEPGPSDRRTASASNMGTPASTRSSARMRVRRKRVASSALNIEALAGQRDERVLQRRPHGRHAADADAGEHELAAAVLRPLAVQHSDDGRAGHG